eukprot:gene2125-1991_t
MSSISILSKKQSRILKGKEKYNQIQKNWLELQEYETSLDEEIFKDQDVQECVKITSKNTNQIEYTIDDRYVRQLLSTEQNPEFPVPVPLNLVITVLDEIWDDEGGTCRTCILL